MSAPTPTRSPRFEAGGLPLALGAAPYSSLMPLEPVTLITDPADLPEDRNTIPDDALIGLDVWAALQGVKKTTVYSNRVRSEARRKEGEYKTGDMPPSDERIGSTPMWRMSSYRRWEAARPGRGAGAGRPKGTGRKIGPRKVELPLDCPHCGHEITRDDLK